MPCSNGSASRQFLIVHMFGSHPLRKRKCCFSHLYIDLRSSHAQNLDITTTVDYIQILACIALMINAAEIIAERQLYSSNGMYSYAVIKTSSPWMLKGRLAPVLDRVFYSPCYISFVSLQLVVAILLISHLFPSLSWLFVVIILLIQLLSHLRNPFGLDGSDQMQVILFASLGFSISAQIPS